MKSSQSRQFNEFVINWHLTEVCNYSCHYCYAKWEKQGTELIHDSGKIQQFLEQLQDFSEKYNNSENSPFDAVRLNIAGGEPLLYLEKTTQVISLAHQMGMRISLITNASRLDRTVIEAIAPKLSVLGISLDSFRDESNFQIGRKDRHKRVMKIRRLINLLEFARAINSELQIKINTVVNSANWREDMNPIIFHFAPDKWKILRMLPTVTDCLSVTDEQFNSFVKRHRALRKIISAENNADMTKSYVMVDPYGRFFQNSDTGKGYQYSQQILEVGAEEAFSQIPWSQETYLSRYSDQHGALCEV